MPIVFPSAAGCHARPEPLVPAGPSSAVDGGSAYLCGRPAAFVVLGDSSSFVWPALLQEMLDAHAGRRGLYRLLNAAAPAGSVGAWTNPKEPGPLLALAKELSGRAEPRSDTLPPKTALCLVSLHGRQGLGDEGGPVSESDGVGGELGANALERLALALRELGVERVVFATPLYAGCAGPELGLEHVAIERLLARGHIRGHDLIAAGPDIYRASRRYFPDAFEPDGVRANEFGQKLVAEEWYRWLAGPETLEGVVEGLYATDYDVVAIETAAIETAAIGTAAIAEAHASGIV
ncbi:MAG: hypothetical protein HOP15_18210, partial [Planctomycetes bacterium]|nr:hypothetical protein [Planctomycetota bacterium]